MSLSLKYHHPLGKGMMVVFVLFIVIVLQILQIPHVEDLFHQSKDLDKCTFKKKKKNPVRSQTAMTHLRCCDVVEKSSSFVLQGATLTGPGLQVYVPPRGLQ